MTIILCVIIYLLIGFIIDVVVHGEGSIFTPIVMLIWPIAVIYEIIDRLR